ncbi:conserved protein of unknown function [Blastococcus saxobsidens DD2]|uniref:Uncharacterized protein n=1 Tax=Blastococcus saxobsidens (strain DD2) TaxID=1146883 RepID=H6RNJ1_BLASD|nr:conserved protein of unknown function [Blastococcus saxobsidens DD2]
MSSLRSPPVSSPAAGFEYARAVADAILYEGYLLYPYRRSSPKNRVRWQFGVLAPREVVAAAGPADTSVAGSADAWHQQTECLLEAPDEAEVHVRLRFLQLQHRAVERRTAAGAFVGVDALDVDGQRHLTFDEALPREFDVHASVGELRGGARTTEVTAPGGEEVEQLRDGAGTDVGRIVRRSWPVSATLTLETAAAEAPYRLHRLRVVTANSVTTVAADVARPEALRHSLVAAHTLIGVRGGRFVSLLEPPIWASRAAEGCRNVHTFPVLAGESGGRDVVLSSPIILYDHPQIAPESPGPLFDSGEIDEILSLRTMTLTDEEKREVRATDPQAAAILDRVDHLPEEVLARLHGAVRSLRPIRHGENAGESAAADEESALPWWEPGADAHLSPDTDAVVVAGVAVTRGSRVELQPRTHGTDAHDVFLAGRTARVEGVFLDVDDERQVAVTLEDDPAAELHQWRRRYHYFLPDELRPLPEEGAVSG